MYFVVPSEGFVLDVLDGQQRLNAIYEFYQNGFPIDGSVLPYDPMIKSLDKKYFSELPYDIKKTFLRYTIRVYELDDYKNDEPHELFFRLNQGSSLTPAEKRNTLYGPVREEVRRLVSLMLDLGYGVETIGFANNRYSYHDVVSRLIFILQNPRHQKKITDSDLVEFFRESPGPDSHTVHQAETALYRLASAFSHKVKLNKATLLTWLLFFSKADIDQSIIWEFDKARERAKEILSVSTGLDYLIYLYNEKSSTSVNDAQPVKIRLFCVYAFAAIHNYPLPDEYSTKVRYVLDHISNNNDFSEDYLASLLSHVQWGQV
ncbi:hypothetical protein MARHY0491 [Marinobacter nauticus ATCC 49840]|nr:hypothetical protein MARHY0491 [Marinobacter nauticus ATCC 49840]